MRSKKEQIGGDHYAKYDIQPFDIIDEYGMDYYEGAALKYLLRHTEKNGKEDLLKCKDYIDCIIDRQYPKKEEYNKGNYYIHHSILDSYENVWTSTATEQAKNVRMAWSGNTDYYAVKINEGWDVSFKCYAFKNLLTDEQMKEVTGEYTDIYIKADKLSVTTVFGIDELVDILKTMQYMYNYFDVKFVIEAVSSSITNSAKRCATFSELIESVIGKFLFLNKIGYENIAMFNNLEFREKWLLSVDGYAVYSINEKYTLAIK